MQAPSAGRGGISAEDARALTERIVGLSQATATRVTINARSRPFIRSADNRITTAGESSDVSVTIMSAFGQPHEVVDQAECADSSHRRD